jgi:hypothetical protein
MITKGFDKKNKSVITLTLGFWPRQGLAKLAGQKWSLGVQKNVKECTLTLPSELPPWELESQWTPKLLEGDCMGQNSLDWEIRYIIEKLLEDTCLKWAHITHLGT